MPLVETQYIFRTLTDINFRDADTKLWDMRLCPTEGDRAASSPTGMPTARHTERSSHVVRDRLYVLRISLK